MRGRGKIDYSEGQVEYSKVCGCGTNAVVGGPSLGGYISLAFFSAYPRKVTAPLVIDTSPSFKKVTDRESWDLYARDNVEASGRRGLSALQAQTTGRKRAFYRNANALARAARGMLTQRDSAVIAIGANDTPNLNASASMAQKIPNARKAVVPNAAHVVNFNQPEGFLQAVLPFLREFGSPKASL